MRIVLFTTSPEASAFFHFKFNIIIQFDTYNELVKKLFNISLMVTFISHVEFDKDFFLQYQVCYEFSLLKPIDKKKV